jgi:hypothetical protein
MMYVLCFGISPTPSLTRGAQRMSAPVQHLRPRRLQKEGSRSKNVRRTRESWSKRGTRWTKPKYVIVYAFYAFRTDSCQVVDAVKRYSYLLGQTDLFRHFVDVQVLIRVGVPLQSSSDILCHIQKARDPDYAAVFDTEPKAKGRGRKKAA